jgi:hypothetical protein
MALFIHSHFSSEVPILVHRWINHADLTRGHSWFFAILETGKGKHNIEKSGELSPGVYLVSLYVFTPQPKRSCGPDE